MAEFPEQPAPPKKVSINDLVLAKVHLVPESINEVPVYEVKYVSVMYKTGDVVKINNLPYIIDSLATK